jgi:hypothetical protein
MLKGRLASDPTSPVDTLLIINSDYADAAKSVFACSWHYGVPGGIALITLDSSVTEENVHMVIGSYSPVVLSLCAEFSRRDICETALKMVFNYYEIVPEGDDMRDVVSMFCYRVSSSLLPITTREGLFSRKLGWMETLIGCDYTKLPSLAGSTTMPLSATSAAFCSNFDMLR